MKAAHTTLSPRQRMLKPTEVLELLAISSKELTALRVAGFIPFHQYNRRVLRYGADDIATFLVRNRIQAR